MPDLKPFEIQPFGGLNTAADSLEVGWAGAVTATNVALDTEGKLKPRPGTASFCDFSADSYQGPLTWTSVDGATKYLTAFCKTTSTKTCTLKYATTAGSVSSVGGAWTGSNAAPTITSVAHIGTPGFSTYFICWTDGSTRKQSKYWNNIVDVTDLSTAMKPLYCCVVPVSNRMAWANFAAAADGPGGAVGDPSTVFFSSANAPDTIDTDNWVYLTSGDGEQITGMAAYRDFLFVFKQTKYFVFYGESLGPDGSTPEFNYRTVTIPVGRVQAGGIVGAQRCCTGPDGVYFVAGTRLYVTDGGPPRVVNDRIEPTSDYGSNVNVQACRDLVFLTPDYTTPGSYVLDATTGDWVYWTVNAPVEFNGGRYLQAVSGGDDDLAVSLDPSIATDYENSGSTAATMSVAYDTGLQQLSEPGTEGVLREVLLDGTGTVTAQIVCDGTNSSTASVTPTAGTIGRYRKTSRGRSFQLKLSSTSGLWELRRVVGNVLPARAGGAS